MRTYLSNSNSASQAQAILGAWATGDVQLFCNELDRVSRYAAEPADSDERERLELLSAIAADLRVPSIQPLADDPSSVHGNLLRHLAFSQRSLALGQGLSENRLPETSPRNGFAIQ
jgi:hypothetical protein